MLLIIFVFFGLGTSEAKEGCEKWTALTFKDSIGNANTKHLAACKVFFKQSENKTQCDLILDFEKNQKESCLVQMALTKNGGRFSNEDQALSMQGYAVEAIKSSNAIKGSAGNVRRQDSDALYEFCCREEEKNNQTPSRTLNSDGAKSAK